MNITEYERIDLTNIPSQSRSKWNGKLHQGEVPQDLVGFSVNLETDSDGKPRAIFYIERVFVTYNESIDEQIRKFVIRMRSYVSPGHTQVSFSKFTESFVENFTQVGETDAFDKAVKMLNSSKRVVVNPRPDGTYKVHNISAPLLNIYRPTLFIYTTNQKDGEFEGKYIGAKSPSVSLDPNCSKLRLWDDKKVMGLYSAFKAGHYFEKSLYWYNLENNITFPPDSFLSGKKINLGGLYDPGTSNGGGEEFP